MEEVTSYRTYWGIWLILLFLTLLMIVLEGLDLPTAGTVLLLSIAMMVKAVLIAGWFMHLRYERLALVLSVVLAIVVTAAFMYFLLIPDALVALRLEPE